jgi:predicted tellurium resistance membrane protein TerC
MDRYPYIVYLGAAILGKVGGEMMITDPFTETWLHPTKTVVYAVEAIFAVGVIVVGKIWMRWTIKAEGVKQVHNDEREVALGLHKDE